MPLWAPQRQQTWKDKLFSEEAEEVVVAAAAVAVAAAYLTWTRAPYT